MVFSLERLPLRGDIFASLVAAGNRVYVTAHNGETVVIRSDSDSPSVVAVNRIGEKIVASPALAGESLFLRGDSSLYHFAEGR